MDIEEAKNIIINYKIKKEKEEQLKIKAIKEKQEMLKKQIRALEPRIKDIIVLGNFCLKNDIKVWQKGIEDAKYENKCFETDGIKHQLGFYRNHFKGYPVYRCSEYDYIGFENGGFCGDWDFVTNGKEIFEVHEEKDKMTTIGPHSIIREPTVYQMNKFLNDFNKFEKEFFNYIKSYQR